MNQKFHKFLHISTLADRAIPIYLSRWWNAKSRLLAEPGKQRQQPFRSEN